MIESLPTALRRHWPEYLMEAAGLGLFMVSACLFGALLEHPGSAVRQAIADPTLRRVLGGTAMGATAIGIIYSPWGKQSGAHINPCVTLTFLRLGKLPAADAVFYVAAQILGGLAGVVLSAALLRGALAHPAVNYVVTVPGPAGVGVAFAAEALISFALMLAILCVSNHARAARLTGVVAGCLVAVYISLEGPLSGMSMNPARSLASALPAATWTAFWIYLTAPALGMLGASQIYLQVRDRRGVGCAKLHHDNPKRCIFCGKPAQAERRAAQEFGATWDR